MQTRLHLWTLLLSGTFASLLCVWACSSHGIGLTDDSGWYSFSAHFGITNTFFNDTLTTFPPLYPLLLSCYKITPFSFYTFSVILNLIAYWAILCAWYKISGINFTRSLFRIFFILAISLSTPIVVNTYMLWSESIFIALLSWSIYFFIKYLEEKSGRELMYSALLLILAFYDRYAAILVLPAYALFFISEKKQKHSHYWLFFAPVIVCCGGWMLRNFILTDKLSGYDPAYLSLIQNTKMIADVVSVFILPDEIPTALRWIVLFITFFIVWKIKERKNIFVLVLTMSYCVVLAQLNSIKNIQEPDERYLSPILIPLFYCIFLAFEKFYVSFSPIPKKIMVGVIVLWLMYPLSRSVVNAQKAAEHGIGYHDTSWEKVSLIGQVNQLASLSLFSNNPIAVVLLTEKKCLSFSVLSNISATDAYVIYWNDQNRLSYLPHSLEDYSKYFTFTEVYSSPEGKIYKAIRTSRDR